MMEQCCLRKFEVNFGDQVECDELISEGFSVSFVQVRIT